MAVGTNMILLPLHNVVDIAEQYATMDVISGGRLILGVGLGTATSNSRGSLPTARRGCRGSRSRSPP